MYLPSGEMAVHETLPVVVNLTSLVCSNGATDVPGSLYKTRAAIAMAAAHAARITIRRRLRFRGIACVGMRALLAVASAAISRLRDSGMITLFFSSKRLGAQA